MGKYVLTLSNPDWDGSVSSFFIANDEGQAYAYVLKKMGEILKEEILEGFNRYDYSFINKKDMATLRSHEVGCIVWSDSHTSFTLTKIPDDDSAFEQANKISEELKNIIANNGEKEYLKEIAKKAMVEATEE